MHFSIKKILFFGITVLSVLLVLGFSYKVAKTDYSVEIPPEKNCPPPNGFKLIAHLKSIDPGTLTEAFPYQLYLDSARLCDIRAIQSDLNAMDSLFGLAAREIFINALTSKYEAHIRPSFDRYNPDSLIALVQWTEKFDHYKDLDEPNAKAYKIIYRYWMNFISNQLGRYYEADSEVKYDFKFRFLTGLCQSKKYSPPLGNSSGEKVVSNFVDQKWAYMFNRFWHGTGILFKLIISLGLLLIIYGFYCIFKVHLKR